MRVVRRLGRFRVPLEAFERGVPLYSEKSLSSGEGGESGSGISSPEAILLGNVVYDDNNETCSGRGRFVLSSQSV
jgi:hypothetical protein